jgi:hypothetical protein
VEGSGRVQWPDRPPGELTVIEDGAGCQPVPSGSEVGEMRLIRYVGGFPRFALVDRCWESGHDWDGDRCLRCGGDVSDPSDLVSTASWQRMTDSRLVRGPVGLDSWNDRLPDEQLDVGAGANGVEAGRRRSVGRADSIRSHVSGVVAEVAQLPATESCVDEVNRARKGIGGSGDSSASIRVEGQLSRSALDSVAGCVELVGGQLEANGHGLIAVRDGRARKGTEHVSPCPICPARRLRK